jgi:hypothetical protein
MIIAWMAVILFTFLAAALLLAPPKTFDRYCCLNGCQNQPCHRQNEFHIWQPPWLSEGI